MSGVKRPGQPSRPAKAGHQPTGDLIALGSKSTNVKSPRQGDETKPTTLKQGTSGSGALPLAPATKKPRVLVSGGEPSSSELFANPIRVAPTSGQQSGLIKPPQAGGSSINKPSPPQTSQGTSSPVPQAIEVRSGELVAAVKDAKTTEGDSKVPRLLLGAVRQLKHSRLKPDPILNAALVQLAEEDGEMFNTSYIIDALVGVLKKETSAIFKAKSNPSVYVLACQLLLHALRDSYEWPDAVAKVYIEDAVTDRLWVDLPPCSKFVDNICTIFQTRLPSAVLGGAAPTPPAAAGGEGNVGGSGSKPAEQDATPMEAEEVKVEQGGVELCTEDIDVEPRFSLVQCKVLRAYAIQMVSEQIGGRGVQTDANMKNSLKFLMTAAGVPEVRLLIVQKIEGWIQNPKITKQCQDVLTAVAVNCHNHSPEDVQVIEGLCGVRLKTKLFSSQFVGCMKELISSHPDNLETALNSVVSNELGQQRGPNNMALLAMMVCSWSEETAKLLGAVFLTFLTPREDYLKALRSFLRELVRQVRNDFNFAVFARSLMREKPSQEFQNLDHTLKERVVLAVADLVTCSSMLMANLLIREAYNGYLKGDKAMVPQLQEFFSTLGLMQRDAVWWMHSVVPATYRPQPTVYKTCLRKVLFLEPAEAYHSKDNWPPEADRSAILHLMSEANLMEDTLMRILVIGLARELPLSPADAMDIADKLVARSANAHTNDIPRLPTVERKELFNAIFDIAVYWPPANIHLPEDYEPPKLAISKLYWKGWILLLVLAAFNPKTIGAIGWAEYPTLRGMMEMVMTNNYSFPTSTVLLANKEGSVESKESAIVRETQLTCTEKDLILEYETHLASQSSSPSAQPAAITEASSYLLNQVTLLRPKGPARKLLPSVIELIKTVNRSLKLGQLLCKCRSPDFLLEVIKKQGTTESIKWLTDLVETNHSSLEVLPVPCLCEFLISSYEEQGGIGVEPDTDPASHKAQFKRKKTTKENVSERQKQLVQRLRKLLVDSQSSVDDGTEVLEYFFDKLAQPYLTPRVLAARGLRDILRSPDVVQKGEEPAGQWLLESVPSLPHFVAILPHLLRHVQQACSVETGRQSLETYFLFLSEHTPEDLVLDTASQLSTTITGRFAIIRKVFAGRKGSSDVALAALIGLFKRAMDVVQCAKTTPQDDSDGTYLLRVTFPAGEKAILPDSLAHASYLLLSLVTTATAATAASDDYRGLLALWFSPHGLPEACTLDTGEKVPLLPPSILSLVLGSTNPLLLEAGVKMATPPQLCSYVQQCGIPIGGVSRILEALDRVVQSAPKPSLFREGLRDPAFLCRCVEAQMMRGAENGHSFHLYLQGLIDMAGQLYVTTMPLAERPSSITPAAPIIPVSSTVRAVPLQLASFSENKMEEVLRQVFVPAVLTPAPYLVPSERDLWGELVSLVLESISSPAPTVPAPLHTLVSILHRLVVSGGEAVLQGMASSWLSSSLVCLLTRALSSLAADAPLKGLLKATITCMSESLERSATPTSEATPTAGTFWAMVRSCAMGLGVAKQHREEEESLVVGRALAIFQGTTGFSDETVVIQMCKDLLGSAHQGHLVEKLLCTLAKEAIRTGQEGNYIRVLCKLHPFLWAAPPIVLQAAPHMSSAGPQSAVLDVSSEEPMDIGTLDTPRGPAGVTGGLFSPTSRQVDSSFSLPHGGSEVTLDASGMLVDLVEVLDPEILSLEPSLALKIVFDNSPSYKLGALQQGGGGGGSLMSGQEYLLARITHECSLNTHSRVMEMVLEGANLKNGTRPSSVLDFLWASLHNPSLWQGCVKKEAVVNSYLSLGVDEECQLNLSSTQLCCVVDCILNEAAQSIGLIKGGGGSCDIQREEDDIPDEAKTILCSRLPLLFSCCHGDEQALACVIKYLQMHTSSPSLGWQLLVHLYHIDRRVIQFMESPTPLSKCALRIHTPSQMDSELHTLITAMTDAQPGQESLTKMTAAAMLTHKVAIQHPAFLIRQLPMLGWLLRGRTYLHPKEFRNRNHHYVFFHTLSVLNLLRPLVFELASDGTLDACLEPFFEFLKNHCLHSKNKLYQSFVPEFSDFLVHYSYHHKEKAAALIHSNLETLQSLADLYPNKKSSLQSLLSCFPRPKTQEQLDQALAVPTILPPLTTGNSLTYEQVRPFLKKLEYGQLQEDVLKVLQDLDETTLHTVDILSHFVSELSHLIQDPDSFISKLAHLLLLRHLKHCPQDVDVLLPAFVSCLESQDSNVVMAAVPSIPDLILLCKGKDAASLLQKLFELSTQTLYNCSADLNKAIQACIQHTFT